ncbi:hypothetical protein VP1G_05591 [Cytospora mali]|uniref:F-box domain-containing protein n=1 Tax=Cytospora mali TaxID=578113 RepID=A0A194V2X3_CYTMA|nr:hypothetical protein VP1G_05591 [Valsa mali var. pyri (nom. inval.)]
MAMDLLSMPAELLAGISEGLDVTDYANLRLCCKHIETLTFPDFAQRFFSRRKFFRGFLSLTTLASISESRFSPYMKTFLLSTVLFEPEPPIEAGNISKEGYLQAYTEQTSILASGWDRDVLIAAFQNLPNLKEIGVEDFDDREDWDEDTGEMVAENDGGYGLKTVLGKLGYGPEKPLGQSAGTYRWAAAVQTLLTAAAKANVRPTVLSIAGRKLDRGYAPAYGIGVDDDAFNIPSFMRQMILPVVEGLEELDLDIHNRFIYQPPDICRTSRLREFLGLPKRLQRLRIHRLRGGRLILGQLDDPVDDLWNWLGSDHKGKDKAPAGQNGPGSSNANLLTSPPPISFPYLQELDLGDEDIPMADLTRLVKKVSPTLRKLSLHDLILRERGNPIYDTEYDEISAEVDLWASFCGKLAALPCEDLYEVSFRGFGGLGSWHLQQFGDASALPDSVHFKVLKMTGEESYAAQAEFHYRGPDVKSALRQLVDDLRAAVLDGRHVFNSKHVQRRNSF